MVGLSILSGSHNSLIPDVVEALRERGVDAPVIVGGIIPEADVAPLKAAGVAAGLHPEGLRPHPDHGATSSRVVAEATASPPPA